MAMEFEIKFQSPGVRFVRYKSDDLGLLFQRMLEQRFYADCKEQLGMDKSEVRERIDAARKAENSVEETLTRIDEIYKIWGDVIDSVNSGLKFSTDEGMWSKLEIGHH